ncbi:hypothetical protein IC575_011531 [Cucumis melo]
MEDSSEDEREMLPEVRKKSFVPRGPTTMSELALVRNSGQKLPIQFNEHGQPVGATSKKQSYIGVCVRQQIPITYNSWKEIPNELKDKIYDCISMSFDLQPNAKHSILMSASRKFRTFKTLVEHSTRKDVVYSLNYTDVNGIIKLLNRHAMNNMEDVDMIRIPMNELIFGSDKFVYLAREDLLHYCGMVEIGYMCILAYITFHWMLHVIDLRENCVYVLDSLRSKVNEDIHGIINVVEDMASETRSTTLSINSKMETCKGNLHLQFNTKNAYRQEEIDEIRTEWRLLLAICKGGKFYMEVYAGILGIIVCIAGELGIIVCIAGILGIIVCIAGILSIIVCIE